MKMKIEKFELADFNMLARPSYNLDENSVLVYILDEFVKLGFFTKKVDGNKRSFVRTEAGTRYYKTVLDQLEEIVNREIQSFAHVKNN